MLDPERTMVTKRLTIEPLLRSHARLLFRALQDERLYRFYAGKAPDSVAALERQYDVWAKRASPDGLQVWLNYALRSAAGRYVGWIQATIEGDTATIGYDIFPDFWRQGYATEACSELIRQLCAAGVRRVLATADTENIASIRLLRRLGFALARCGPSADLPGRQDYGFEYACGAGSSSARIR
jgi:ribosomal-protein-alanine N-acetyltransferase